VKKVGGRLGCVLCASIPSLARESLAKGCVSVLGTSILSLSRESLAKDRPAAPRLTWAHPSRQHPEPGEGEPVEGEVEIHNDDT
jgi:hypothetical protein